MGLSMSKLPPGPRLPPLLQSVKWTFAPLPFMRACADRYGDTFTVRLLGLPPMVFFTDPGAIRQIFTGDADRFRAGQASTAFEPFFGPNSLLLLDGARHRRERKLLMPPFHGRRILRPDSGHAVRVVRRGLALSPSSGLLVIGTAA